MSDSDVIDDMKRALDSVFAPLDVYVCTDFIIDDDDGEIIFITFEHPFYLVEEEPGGNVMNFGVWYQGDLVYPFNCVGMVNEERFVVQNADDWINHAPKFITWYDRCVELMNNLNACKT